MKSRENAAGIGISGILILLVLLPLAAVLFQVVCPDLQIKNFRSDGMDLNGRSIFYPGTGLGIFFLWKRYCQCLAWNTGRWFFYFQLLGTCLCDGAL